MKNCWSHDWTKWEEVVRDFVFFPYVESTWSTGKQDEVKTIRRYQRRVCEKCGKIQEERIRE
jgi:hypothetical protein